MSDFILWGLFGVVLYLAVVGLVIAFMRGAHVDDDQ